MVIWIFVCACETVVISTGTGIGLGFSQPLPPGDARYILIPLMHGKVYFSRGSVRWSRLVGNLHMYKPDSLKTWVCYQITVILLTEHIPFMRKMSSRANEKVETESPWKKSQIPFRFDSNQFWSFSGDLPARTCAHDFQFESVTFTGSNLPT